MSLNTEKTIKFSPMHRLQWEEAQQKDVILYPEGMVELNQSSAEILKLCDGTRNLDQLVADFWSAIYAHLSMAYRLNKARKFRTCNIACL
jgi:coenzyme PQQ biosynthesis protein PqqD